MKKIKLRVPAKLNLTLDILGNSGGYHNIKSLVCSIDIFDTITLKRRTDWDINLINKGIDPECSIVDNNAYKTAKLFSDTFITEGVDMIIEKNIPVGAGLGGSSADIAGVLNGMKALFEVDKSIEPLADNLGSDCKYMLNGGWAIISGRGEKIDFKKVDKTLYFVILLGDESVSTKACYRKFDSLKKNFKPCTERVYKALVENETEKFLTAKNDLLFSAISLMDGIDFNLKALKKAGAPLSIMTGSGSAVVGVFLDQKQRDKVFNILKPLYQDKILSAKSL